MKLLWKVIKRVVISAFVLYVFNYFSINYNFILPINIFSLSVVSFFGTFGFFGLIFFKLFIL